MGRGEIWSHSEQFASYVPNEETSVTDHLKMSEQGRQVSSKFIPSQQVTLRWEPLGEAPRALLVRTFQFPAAASSCLVQMASPHRGPES